MTETPRDPQAGVAGALQDLSDNSRALVRYELTAVQREMWEKAKQGAPAFGLLAAAGLFGILSVAASFKLSLRSLDKVLPPGAAAFTAAAGYGLAAGAAGAAGLRELKKIQPLAPVETAREAAETAGEAAETAREKAKQTAKSPRESARTAAGKAQRAARR